MSIDSQTGAGATEQRKLAQASRLDLLRQFVLARVPLVALTLLVLAAHTLGYLGREAARRKNIKILHPLSELEFRQPSSADPAIGKRTGELLEYPCRLAPVATCDTTSKEVEESRMIGRIRTGATDGVLRQRLAKSRYPSALELLQELIDARHHESVANAVTVGFDGSRKDAVLLIDFAVRRNLEPALVYRFVGREEEAVEQLQLFTDLTLPIVRKGYWVSASGLDVTDLPVLHSTFCSVPDQLVAKRCKWALLNALAETLDSNETMRSETAFEADTIREYDLHGWSANRRGLDLSSAYGRQSPLFANSMMNSYLNAIGQLGLRHAAGAYDILKTIPVFESPAQEALWYYQLGRSALLLAAWHPEAGVCQRFKREAADAFRHSFRADDIGLLAAPAAARLVETNGICASSN